MPKESWRIPFILGGLFAFIIYFYRKQITETEDFIKDVVFKKIKPTPWKEVLLNYKRNIAVSCLTAGMMIMPLYLATIFANRLFKEVGYSQSQSMFLNMLAMFLDAVFVLYFGRLADKIGFKRQLIIGSLIASVVAFPAFVCVLPVYMTTFSIYLFIFLLTIPGCIVTGSAMPYIGSLFPTTCRYTGTAISVTVGHALLGGTTPLVASFLTDYFETRIAPAFWLMFFSCLAAIWVAYSNPYSKHSQP
jgi:MFS family permease